MTKIKIMKTLSIFTATLALSFLIYALYKKSINLSEDLTDSSEQEPHSHHITDVFAKAKKVAMPEEQ